MTATALREEAAALEAAAEESFQRCDTDGFVSQWASGLTAQLKRAEAGLVEAGGVAEFAALFDAETGERVPAKLIDGKFGLCWALVTPGTDRFTGEFVSAFPKREATMARKGFREGHELAPAKAVIRGSGHGLAGATTCRVVTVRVDDGTGQDDRVVTVPEEG